MHGTFVEPISISNAASLVPIFSGSKLLVNNDILLPLQCIGPKKSDLHPVNGESTGEISATKLSGVARHLVVETVKIIGLDSIGTG